MQKIVFPEGEDDRIKQASIKIKEFADVILLTKGSIDERLEEAKNLLKNNKADAVITGATHPTNKTIKLALNFKKGLISSFFLIDINNKRFLFADCAVNPNPNAEQLAEITLQTANSAKLFNITPRIAMLSYSTKGSAEGEIIEKIQKATEIVKKKTNLIIDGELQVDSALIPEVAKIKNSDIIKGDANILIFPDLNSGNISYKLIERFANTKAIGPILQNLTKPINDLSRGCKIENIIEIAKITINQLSQSL
ncbi:MAG: phosphate acetyltransferase [Nanoarchaeota archaeon]|nr:phosphate acetyltransferase [Nanoarchaeota archaeon]